MGVRERETITPEMCAVYILIRIHVFSLPSLDTLQILLNATPRYDAAGNVVGVIGIGQDVTQELSQQADLLRLLDTANAPIIGIDAENCVNEWNQKAVTLTGFSREEAMGKPLVEKFIEPRAQASVQAVLNNALQGQPRDNYQFTLMTKDKQPLQVRRHDEGTRERVGVWA